MSTDLQSLVAELQFYNYMGIAIASAVVYDYIVTFTNEINYIWNRPWTFVSSMFVLVRYLGLYMAFCDAFYGTPFIPGSILASTVLLLLRIWGFIIFLAAADIVMILRLYAMYNRSKVVLVVLLVFYVATLVLYAISGGYYNNPNTYLTMTVAEVLDMSFCNPTYTYSSTSKLGVYKLIPRTILAGLLIILVVTRLWTESYQTYKITKQWKTNQYLQLLTKEGVLYFLGHLLYIIDFGDSVPAAFVSLITTIVMYTLSPRFIMSVRGLYLRNLYGWNRDIDSGFGMGKGQFTPVVPSISLGFTGGTSVTTSEGDVEMRVLRSQMDEKD